MTPEEAAQWMLDQANTSDGTLHQETAAAYLNEFNDERLAYWNDAGILCVSKTVLDIFRKITPNYVFVRTGKFWRPREEFDRPGRQQ